MFRFGFAALVVLVVLGALAFGGSDECPDFPKPVAEHQWLQQLVGEWEYEIQLCPPGQPPVKSKGTETIRAVGGFWTVAENKGTFMNAPFTGLLTLGYDAERRRYLGTWIDSMSGYLWSYEGTVDKAGKALTLESEGPCCATPGKLARVREVLEVKSKDQKTFNSAVQAEDGSWTTMVSIDYRRK